MRSRLFQSLLDAAAQDCVVLQVPRNDELVLAIALVKEQELLGTSGESKRHQVYARLLKEFPNKRRRDVALLIEVALLEQE